MNEGLLEECLEDVGSTYNELGGSDQVAKSGQFLSALKRKLSVHLGGIGSVGVY